MGADNTKTDKILFVPIRAHRWSVDEHKHVGNTKKSHINPAMAL